VAIDFAHAASNLAFEHSVLANLQTSLGERDIDVCTGTHAASPAPIASIRVSQTSSTTVSIAVEVDAEKALRRVVRDVNLSRVPEDGRALAIAVATDELVWATWAELALEPQKHQRLHPQTPAPAALVTTAPTPPPQPQRNSATLRVAGMFEHYTGGASWWGGDVALGLRLRRFLFQPEAALVAGVRRGLPESATHGSVTSQALILGLDVRASLLREGALDFGMSLTERTGFVRFIGTPHAGAQATSIQGVTIDLGLRADLRVSLGNTAFLSLAAGAATSLRSLEALDETTVVTGVSGYSGLGSLELGFRL